MAAHVSLSDSFQVSMALQHSDAHGHRQHSLRNSRSFSSASASATKYANAKDRSISCGTRFLLAAVAYGPEASVSFELVYSVLSLQYLGVPVYLVSMNGIVCGVLSMFLIPTMGSFADKGTNPKKRRMMSLLLGLSMFVAGFWILAISSGLRAGYLKEITETSQSHEHDFGRSNTYLQNTTVTLLNKTSGAFSTEENHLAVPIVVTNDSNTISTTGILGILGFTCLDIGFDTSMSQIRTFLMDSVPAHQSAHIIATSTLVMSFGGIFNTFLGMFDLPSLLGPIFGMDGVAATLIVMCLGISTLTIAAYITSFLMGCSMSHSHYRPEENQCLIPKGHLRYPSANRNSKRTTAAAAGQNVSRNNTTEVGQSVVALDGKTKDGYLNRESCVHSSISSRDVVPTKTTSKDRKLAFLSQWAFILNTRLLLVFLASFFSFGCLSVITIYLSNTFTIEVMKGDPMALRGSEGKARYEKGLRASSTAALLSYLSYLAISLFNKRLIDFFGPKLMFLMANALLSASCIMFCVAQTVSTFYVFMAVYGTYRCICYTMPFLLATTFTQKEDQPGHNTVGVEDGNLAKVMSVVGFLFTSIYLLTSCALAPVMDATGSAWPPAYFVAGASAFTVLPLTVLLIL